MTRTFGGIELGGTKTVVVLGQPGAIREREEFPTTTPDETLSRAVKTLLHWREHGLLDAAGIASFGPVRVAPEAADFGTMLDTPKPGWAGAPVLSFVAEALSLPLAIDTDVNAAALAEYGAGAAQGCPVVVYLTIGTGVGGGVLLNGAPLHGMLHPEIGHVRLRRMAGDAFPGICRFHGDCVEGLLSGPALVARFGRHPGEVEAGDRVWDAVAHDLAEVLAMLVLTLSPQRIVVGGGVTNRQPHLLPATRSRLPHILGGYLRDCTHAALERLVVPPALGDDAGPMGSLILAEQALAAKGAN
ncbi:ROK family protein [Novosphingobium mangrovi (ex Huang et al. 2023)]|uniref:fructokinase n=1 Tax=Novosphingobium mangrovi (ex Huang et al. 2023) TaxID=2976432 RepID=A0ABT2I2X2_9SPHN|nr:ROK family protein [Novosphingobium mangrovi (ex Huang et al. 2023)]MCT2398998.1 ROK family protein [Novosphingobium mangrovi (ex Huang et al. 2023)]